MSNSIPDYYVVPLSNNHFSFISSQDLDLAENPWTLFVTQSGIKYAHRRFSGKLKYMHRIILARVLGRDLAANEIVDHINGFALDNRRENIRLATRTQNNWNMRRAQSSKAIYRGVRRNVHGDKWSARIRANGKTIHIGSFDTAEAAYEAYCKASQELHGEFSRVD